MEVHPTPRQAEAGGAPLGGVRENRARSSAVEAMLLALLGLLCRHLGLSPIAPSTGWTVPQLLHAIATLIPTLRPRRHRTPALRPFIPRHLRRGSPELRVVNAYRLPPRDPARPLRRLPPRARQGRDPPVRAHIP